MVKGLVVNSTNLSNFSSVLGHWDIFNGRPGYNIDDFEEVLYRWSRVVPQDEYTDIDAYIDSMGGDMIVPEYYPGVQKSIRTVEAFLALQLPHLFVGSVEFFESFQKFATNMAMKFYSQAANSGNNGALFNLTQTATSMLHAGYFSLQEISVIFGNIDLDNADPLLAGDLLSSLSGIHYNFASDSLSGDVTPFVYEMVKDVDISSSDPWDGFDDWFAQNKYILGSFGSDWDLGKQAWRHASGNTALDILRVYHEVVQGSAGNDALSGDSSPTIDADLLIGGAGDDLLGGGAGDDTYVFADGSGHDIIADTSGLDEIAFQGGLLSSLARFAFVDSSRKDILISFTGRFESVLVKDYFNESSTTHDRAYYVSRRKRDFSEGGA